MLSWATLESIYCGILYKLFFNLRKTITIVSCLVGGLSVPPWQLSHRAAPFKQESGQFLDIPQSNLIIIDGHRFGAYPFCTFYMFNECAQV